MRFFTTIFTFCIFFGSCFSQGMPDSTFVSFDIENINTSDIDFTTSQFSQGRTLLRFNYSEDDSVKIEAILVRGNVLAPGFFMANQGTQNRILEGIIRVKVNGNSGTSFSFYNDPRSLGMVTVDSIKGPDWFGSIDYQIFNPITGDTINFTGVMNKIKRNN